MPVTGPMVTRRRIVQVKLETDRGTAVTPDLPILAFDPRIEARAPFIGRRPADGASGGQTQGLLGERVGTVSLRVELRGNGNAVTPNFDAAIAALLQCCGFKLDTGVYKPTGPADQKTCTITIHEDGLLKKLHGCAGNVTFEGEWGKPCYASFEMSGVWNAPTDVAVPTVSQSTVLPPRCAACTFTVDSTTPRIGRWNLNMGMSVQPREDVSAAEGVLHYYAADREPVIEMEPEALLVATYDLWGKWNSYAQVAFSLLVGSAAGNKFTLAIPKLQFRELTEGDRGGKFVHSIRCACGYTTALDDEVSLTPA
jgi:hypothetical protein